VIAAIHETTVVRVVLNECLNLLADSRIAVVASIRGDVNPKTPQETLDETPRLGLIVELKFDGYAREVGRAILGVLLHDTLVMTVVGLSVLRRGPVAVALDVQDIPRGFHNLVAEKVGVGEAEDSHCVLSS